MYHAPPGRCGYACRTTLARRPCRQPDPQADTGGTREWSGRSPRGRPPSAHPRGGWGRAGRCSQLLSDAKHPQHPQNGFWLGRNPLKKMSVGVAHKIPGSLYIILGHTLRSKCPGGASGGEPGSASKSAEGARYERALWCDIPPAINISIHPLEYTPIHTAQDPACATFSMSPFK